jgi:hypothetical protein
MMAEPGNSPTGIAKFCRSCGTNVGWGNGFCVACGQPTTDAIVAAIPQVSTTPTLRIALGVFLGIAGLAVLSLLVATAGPIGIVVLMLMGLGTAVAVGAFHKRIHANPAGLLPKIMLSSLVVVLGVLVFWLFQRLLQ